MRNWTLEKEVSGRSVMRLEGDFDRESALALREELSRAKGDVLIDFSLVHEFEDLGVATLARTLMERVDSREHRRVALRGLRQHQLRLFRYIGVEVDEAVSSSDSTQPG